MNTNDDGKLQTLMSFANFPYGNLYYKIVNTFPYIPNRISKKEFEEAKSYLIKQPDSKDYLEFYTD